MQPSRSANRIAQIKMIATVIIWAGSFIAIKIAVGQASPVTVVWLRLLIGLLILGLVAYRRGELGLPSLDDAFKLLLVGFLGITLHQWLQSNALVTTEASTTAWIVSTIPVFMVLLGWFFLKEKPGWITVLGIFLAAVGVLLVVSKGELDSLFQGDFGKPGDILVLISALNWAVFSILSRPLLKHYSATRFTFYIMLFGWLLSSLQFLAGAKWIELGKLSPDGWLSIIYLGVFCSALAYIFYNDGLKLLPISQVGAFLYLQPLVATLLAALLLSEEIMFATLAGGGLILLGIWLVNRNTVDRAS